MSTTFRPLAYSTLASDCYVRIKEAILNLELAPDAPIDEGQTAAELGISKTPVREALARLIGEGFVISGTSRRSFVASLSLQHIREIYQVRIMLETASIREITPRLTEEVLAGLARGVADAETALTREDLGGFLQANRPFHTSLIECSENRYLISLARGLFDHARRVNAAIFRVEQRSAQHSLSAQGLAVHRSILDALAARDADRAADLIRHDIQLSLDAISTPEMQKAFAALTYRLDGTRRQLNGKQLVHAQLGEY